MTSLIDRILSPFKEFGWFDGTFYVLDRALGRLSPNTRLFYYELMVQPITGKSLLPEKLSSQIVMREIKPGDPEMALMPIRKDILESRLQQSTIALGAYHKDKYIGYIWFCFGSYLEDEVRCIYDISPEKEAVFDFDIYLFPESRFGLGFIGIWDGANKYLSSQGIKYTFSRLTPYNLASKKAHAHLGWQVAARAFILKLWSVEVLVTNTAPYFHLSPCKSNRARISLKPDGLLAKSGQNTG